MVNCQKCRRSEPLNLICLDQKCGPQQNLNLICCTCHNAALIHHTISINMFLDIAFIATQSWIDSKQQTNCLIDEVENLIQKLQERKAKMVQFLSYYDKTKHKYNKLQNSIQEFRYQINDLTYDDYEEFEETFLEIKNHFSFVPNNPRLPIKLNSEQSLDEIQSNLQEELNEFSKSYLQLLEIRDEDLKQLLQQQIQSQNTSTYNQNGYHSNGVRNNTSSYHLKGNSNLNGNIKGQKISFSASNSSNQQNSKKCSTNFITLQQQIQNLYEPKEMLDYDELYSKNCIDIGFKVVPKYVEERKNIEKSSNQNNKKNGGEDTNKISQNQNNNSTSISQNQVTDTNIENKMEIEQMTNSTLQSENQHVQIKNQQQSHQNAMEIEKKEEFNQEQKQSLNYGNNHSESKHEKDSSQQQQFEKQALSAEDQKDKKDIIQCFDVMNQKTISNENLSTQQQQQQINKLEKKILTRSASATNTNNQGSTSVAQFTSQPTSLTTIPQANNATPEKEKEKEKEKQREREREKLKQQQKVEKDIEQINQINKKADSYSNISQSSKQNLDSKQQFSQRRNQNNEEDQDMSSNRKSRDESSDDDDDENNDAQKSQSFPSGKKPKYIKKYDRKGQDYLKTLTEEQIDVLIVDYNHLKNWREVEKKWGISKYHIIKFFKEKNFILTSQDENELETESK
ncbi:hypothetical protein ABPG72_016014 [Tetrahymena utriculariae]